MEIFCRIVFFADTAQLISAEYRPLLVDKFEHIVEVGYRKYPFARKLDKKLNTIALKYFPRDSLTERYFFSKLVEVDSGYLVAGSISAFAPKAKQSISFLMLDYDLNVKKEYIIKAKELNYYIAVSYLEVIDGEIHIMYAEGGPNGEDLDKTSDVYRLVKYDTKTNTIQTLLEHDFKKSGFVSLRGFQRTANGNWLFGAAKYRKIYVGKNASIPLIFLFDKDFKEISRTEYGVVDFHENLEGFHEVLKTNDGFYVFGNCIDKSDYAGVCLVVKHDVNGKPLWKRYVHSPYLNNEKVYGTAYDGMVLSDGSLVVSGSSRDRYAWLFRMDADGCVLQNDCNIITSTTETTFHNLNIYPNPTQDVLHIESETGEYMQRVVVYNSLGTIVYSTDNQAVENISLDTSPFSDGVYIVKVEFQNREVQTYKFSVLR